MKTGILFFAMASLLTTQTAMAACTTEQIKTVLNAYTDEAYANCDQNVSFGASTGNSLYFVQVTCGDKNYQFGVTVNESENGCKTSLLNDLFGRTVEQYK